MPRDDRLEAQVRLILDAFPDAAPFPEDWERTTLSYLYRQGVLLARDADVATVAAAVTRVLDFDEERRRVEAGPAGPGGEGGEGGEGGPVAGGGEGGGPEQARTRERIGRVEIEPIQAGMTRLRYAAPGDGRLSAPRMLDALDALGLHLRAWPEYLMHLCGHACPATEPEEVPPGTVEPFPAMGSGGSTPFGDGAGVSVCIIDTGLIEEAADRPWMVGVTGEREDPYDPGPPTLKPYAAHGTFVAGVLRAVAPRADVHVLSAPVVAGAQYETEIAAKLGEALALSPDIVVLTLATETARNEPLPTLQAVYDRAGRPRKGLVVVVPAGNAGSRELQQPGASSWTLAVGALDRSWRTRAGFSNFGSWVDLYAPGEGLVNAFASGEYTCREAPNIGEVRTFAGLATWSGTSFSTPVAAGLIAREMSASGLSATDAVKKLLRRAKAHAVPGVGPMLVPGESCSCHENGD